MIHTGISVISIHNSLCLLPLVPVVVFLPRLSSASFAHDTGRVRVQYTNCLRISLMRGGSLSNSTRPMYPSCQCTNIVLQDKPSNYIIIILTNCTFHSSVRPYLTITISLDVNYSVIPVIIIHRNLLMLPAVVILLVNVSKLMLAWSHFTVFIMKQPTHQHGIYTNVWEAKQRLLV